MDNDSMQLLFPQFIDDDDEILNDTTSSSSDSDVEHVLEMCFAGVLKENESRNTPKNFCEEVGIVPSYTNREFIMHFRLSRDLAHDLTEKFTNSDQFPKLVQTGKSRQSITPNKHILAFLWFAGHQTASFRDVADRFDLSLGSLHAIITRVSQFLSSMAHTIIKRPSDDHKQMIMDHYQSKGFPGVIGYPGSVHDARVFRNSDIADRLPDLCQGCYILGDSAYPLLGYLLTPYRDNGHLTRAQKNYNKKLSSCRVSIEHAFGVLKQRFRQLYHLKLRRPDRICHFIRACCVLHNVADQDDLQAFAVEDAADDVQPDMVDTHMALISGMKYADNLLSNVVDSIHGKWEWKGIRTDVIRLCAV